MLLNPLCPAQWEVFSRKNGVKNAKIYIFQKKKNPNKFCLQLCLFLNSKREVDQLEQNMMDFFKFGNCLAHFFPPKKKYLCILLGWCDQRPDPMCNFNFINTLWWKSCTFHCNLLTKSEIENLIAVKLQIGFIYHLML